MSEEAKKIETRADKPGFKTSEFWINVVAIIAGIVIASGLIEDGGMVAQIVGGIMSSLAAASYTAGRSVVKRKQIDAPKS